MFLSQHCKTNSYTFTTFLLIFVTGIMGTTPPNESPATVETGEKFAMEAQACRSFADNFYKIVSGELKSQNIIASPFSVHILLSYLSHGARGRTAQEMVTGLSISDTERLHIGYKELMALFNSLVKADLQLSNSVFLHNNVKLVQAFSSIGADYYSFGVSKLDFKDSINSAKKINDWVMEKTKNKIKDIITPDDISEDTKMILVNAIYFKSAWESTFDPKQTELKDFHVTKDSVKRVPMMYQKRRYRQGYVAEVEAKFLEISYADNNLSMMIILPDSIDGLSAVEKNFNWQKVLNAESKIADTILLLPRFKIERQIDLNKILQSLGFETMLQDKADFSGVAELPLKVDKVVQKAFIEVTELGTEAAVVTKTQMRTRRAVTDLPVEFTVDRPFMIVIRHKPTDIPLFIGSIRDIGESAVKDEL